MTAAVLQPRPKVSPVGRRIAAIRRQRRRRALDRLDAKAQRATTRATVARTGGSSTARTRAAKSVHLVPGEAPWTTINNFRKDRQEAKARGLAVAPRRPATYVLLSLVTAVLCLVGLVMVLSASSVQGLMRDGSGWGTFRKQLFWLVLGAIACWVVAHTDYRYWRRFANLAVGVTAAALGLVLIPGIGTEVYGSSRWLGIGPLSVQPSEIAKLAVVLFVAVVAERRMHTAKEFHAVVAPATGVVMGLGVLLVFQPDLSAVIVLALIAYATAYIGGARGRHILGIVAVAAVGLVLLTAAFPYQRRRFTSFLNPFADAEGDGYQTVQSLVGLGSGEVSGVGLGMSRAKWGFLPQAQNDFIFTIIGEELGFIGAVSVLLLFAAFLILGVRAAMRAPDRFGVLVAAGITAWIALEVMVNVGAVTGVLPVTGLPLPFVSAGGSSLTVTLIATGMLLNIARQGVAHEAPKASRKSSTKKKAPVKRQRQRQMA